MLKRLPVLCVIALVVFLAVVLVARSIPLRTAQVQVAASDWMMVDAQGPRLGARPVRDDVALVLMDMRSAAELGYVRSYQDDLALYGKLLAAGARVVYDTRTVAAADAAAFDEVRPLLDGMLELRDDGSLCRDAYLGADLMTEMHPRYGPLLAPNLVNAHPHAVPSIRSRYYPMFHYTSIGLMESAPLAVARQVWDAEPVDPDTLKQRLLECGVMTAWHAQAPDSIEKSEVARAPYRIGEHAVVWHPFLTSTILVAPAAFWVDYGADVSAYERHSFIDVLREADPPGVDGKIVLIGYSPETEISPDNYEVPSVPRKAAAAEVVAAAVQTLLDGRTMREVPQWLRYVLLGLMCLAAALVGGWLRPIQAVLASLGLLLAYFAGAVLAYRAGWYTDFALAPLAAGSSAFLGIVYSSWLSVRARQRVVDVFGRYVPRAVVNQLMLQPDLRTLVLGGVKQDVSVMFADVRGFTTFSEDLPPEEVVRQLNSLLEIMVECTFENEGTLDKFIGDAVLVLFNAPLKQVDHVARAVRTATAIQQRLAKHPTGLSVGIGLHRGEAVVGNIGTPRRLEYTAIGSTVNIASRLCGVAAPGEVIISAAMVDDLDDEFQTQALDPVTVKGLKKPLAIYRVLD